MLNSLARWTELTLKVKALYNICKKSKLTSTEKNSGTYIQILIQQFYSGEKLTQVSTITCRLEY